MPVAAQEYRPIGFLQRVRIAPPGESWQGAITVHDIEPKDSLQVTPNGIVLGDSREGQVHVVGPDLNNIGVTTQTDNGIVVYTYVPDEYLEIPTTVRERWPLVLGELTDQGRKETLRQMRDIAAEIYPRVLHAAKVHSGRAIETPAGHIIVSQKYTDEGKPSGTITAILPSEKVTVTIGNPQKDPGVRVTRHTLHRPDPLFSRLGSLKRAAAAVAWIAPQVPKP